MSMLSELSGQLRLLLSGRAGIADGILPPVVFAVVNVIAGVTPAAWAGAGTGVAIVLWRLARRKPLKFAFSGLAGTLIATAFALRSGRAETFYLPGIISGAVTTVVIIGTLIAGRPFVAYASWVSRSWPIEWYWHPKVRPAYALASWLWAAYFGTRTTVTWWLFTTEQTEALAAVRVATGWPGLVALLAATYVVGRRRLTALGGPSVEEFEENAPPPWSGQEHGF